MPENIMLYAIIVILAAMILFLLKAAYKRRSVASGFEIIDELEGTEFEEYCADLLEKTGFQEVEITKGSGDFGLDILCERDGITYGIQCKRYDKPIGVAAIQQAYAGRDYYDRMVGVVMTNQYFTEAAVKAAKKLNILLWDRGYLDEMEG